MERAGKVLGNRRFKAESFTSDRMIQTELLRVKRLSSQRLSCPAKGTAAGEPLFPFDSSVESVGEQRVTSFAEMHSDLMRSAR